MAGRGSVSRAGLRRTRRRIKGQTDAGHHQPECDPPGVEQVERRRAGRSASGVFRSADLPTRTAPGKPRRRKAERSRPPASPANSGVQFFMRRSAPNKSPASWNGPRNGRVTASNRLPLPGRCFASRHDDDEQRGRQLGYRAGKIVQSSTTASRPATNAALMTICEFARARTIDGDGDKAEHAEKQRERDADCLPAVEQPVGERDAGWRRMRAAATADERDAISKSEAVAIDMVSFPGMHEGEMAGFLSFGFGRAAFGSAMTAGRAGGEVSHQLIASSRRGSRDRRNRKGMIFAMAATMPGRLAARLPDLFRICGFLCRFRADACPTGTIVGILDRASRQFGLSRSEGIHVP